MSAPGNELLGRIRGLLAGQPGIVERRVVGGTGFMVNGTLAISATARGDLLVRVGPAGETAALALPGAFRMKMGGREMVGYVGVAAADLADTDDLAAWVQRGLDHAGALAAK